MQKARTIYLKKGERPPIPAVLDAMPPKSYLVADYERALFSTLKGACFHKNELARAQGGELALEYRIKRAGDNILVYRL